MRGVTTVNSNPFLLLRFLRLRRSALSSTVVHLAAATSADQALRAAAAALFVLAASPLHILPFLRVAVFHGGCCHGESLCFFNGPALLARLRREKEEGEEQR